MKPSILITSGNYFDFNDPENSVFGIRDIAQSLSMLCRFNGHVKQFYSVAQHSVHVSNIVKPEFAMAGLMHDGHEAFTGDMTAPIKLLLPDYKKLEKRIQKVVLRRFDIDSTLPQEVHYADLIALATEKRDIAVEHKNDNEWGDLPSPESCALNPVPPSEAYDLFIARFVELHKTRVW